MSSRVLIATRSFTPYCSKFVGELGGICDVVTVVHHFNAEFIISRHFIVVMVSTLPWNNANEWRRGGLLTIPSFCTPVLKWTVVLKCVKECNMHMPYHFGILKVYRFQKVKSKKNLTSPFWENDQTLFLYLVRSQICYIWFSKERHLYLICVIKTINLTFLFKVFHVKNESHYHQWPFEWSKVAKCEKKVLILPN